MQRYCGLCHATHAEGAPCPRSLWRVHGGALDARRGSAAERGYDARWHALRRAYIAAHPLCEACLASGRYVPAAEVDHIIPISERPDLRLVAGNLQALCRSCHRHKTAAEQRHAGQPSIAGQMPEPGTASEILGVTRPEPGAQTRTRGRETAAGVAPRRRS